MAKTTGKVVIAMPCGLSLKSPKSVRFSILFAIRAGSAIATLAFRDGADGSFAGDGCEGTASTSATRSPAAFCRR